MDSEKYHKIDLDKPGVDQILLLVSEGDYVKKSQNIAKYFLKRTKEGIDKKPNIVFVKSPIFGQFVKYKESEKTIVLEKCMHDTFYGNICIKCKFNKSVDGCETTTFNKDKKESCNSYAAINPALQFSDEKARNEEKLKVTQYLSTKKLILLLDLDNTILHTSPCELTQEEFNKLQSKYHEYVGYISVQKQIYSQTISFEKIFVKFRPHLKEFLTLIQDKYEIFTYTHGTKDYASAIIDYINKNIYEGCLSTSRLIARQTGKTNCEIKSIKKVFPTLEDMVVIMDDRPNVWAETDENLIYIFPYVFFYDQMYNQMDAKYLTEDFDCILYVFKHILNYIHGEFYDFYKRNEMKKSVKIIIKEKLHSIFGGMKFTSSGIYTKDSEGKYIDKDNTGLKQWVEKIGGEFIIEEQGDLNPIDCLLINNIRTTKKYNYFKKNNKPILHSCYANCCNMFLFKLDYDLFNLTENYRYPNLKEIFEKNKDNIRQFYRSKLEPISRRRNSFFEPEPNEIKEEEKEEESSEKKEEKSENKKEKKEENKSEDNEDDYDQLKASNQP
ncbi:MAG: hypothetical protein MJ252_20940 [archaeon]|nr:hypothetical protein [archaeon]